MTRSHYYTKILLQSCRIWGHKVVAEGVETQEEIDLLKQWGVDLVQGYYYTKPLDSEQIIHKLEKDVC